MAMQTEMEFKFYLLSLSNLKYNTLITIVVSPAIQPSFPSLLVNKVDKFT